MTYGAAFFSPKLPVTRRRLFTLSLSVPKHLQVSPQLALHLESDKIVLPAGWDTPSNLTAMSAADSSEQKFTEMIQAPPSSADDDSHSSSDTARSKVTAYSTDGFLERIYKLQSTSSISSQLRSAVTEPGGSRSDLVLILREPPAPSASASAREVKKTARTSSTRPSRARTSKSGEADAVVADAKDGPEVIKDFSRPIGPKRSGNGERRPPGAW